MQGLFINSLCHDAHHSLQPVWRSTAMRVKSHAWQAQQRFLGWTNIMLCS